MQLNSALGRVPDKAVDGPRSWKIQDNRHPQSGTLVPHSRDIIDDKLWMVQCVRNKATHASSLLRLCSVALQPFPLLLPILRIAVAMSSLLTLGSSDVIDKAHTENCIKGSPLNLAVFEVSLPLCLRLTHCPCRECGSRKLWVGYTWKLVPFFPGMK